VSLRDKGEKCSLSLKEQEIFFGTKEKCSGGKRDVHLVYCGSLEKFRVREQVNELKNLFYGHVQ
jgi:hypothetical protein